MTDFAGECDALFGSALLEVVFAWAVASLVDLVSTGELHFAHNIASEMCNMCGFMARREKHVEVDR